VELAREEGIELRQVTALTPSEFSGWLLIQHIRHQERVARLDHARLIVNVAEPEERKQALLEVITGAAADDFLKSSKTGEMGSAAAAFSAAVNHAENDLFASLVANESTKKVRLRTRYPNDEDHFIVETRLGPIRIEEILYSGELSLRETLVPLTVTSEYRDAQTGNVISQLAAFAPQTIHGMKFSVEMHRIGETGETHVVMRRLHADGV
jgi:hypothetical protein